MSLYKPCHPEVSRGVQIADLRADASADLGVTEAGIP
jgi:hypothetical protein